MSICRVSIIIKALNEEKRIAPCIESALAAVAPLGGEVILADSCSTDCTIEIAQRYPIAIVQLSNAAERCCGIGPQLGYQHSSGEYVYILDGDMEIRQDFLALAVAFLDQHPEVGGVGGQVVEHNVESLEYLARVERNATHMTAGTVDRLDMGGLYRRSAVEQVGYFSNRNLHSYEELDLGARLRAHGWSLQRIAVPSVDHYGHSVSPYLLLSKRWKSGYIMGSGEVVRAAFGQRHFGELISSLREVKLYLAATAWLLLGMLVSIAVWAWPGSPLVVSLVPVVAFLALPFLALLLRKGSLAKALYAYTSLWSHCAGFLKGLVRRQADPSIPISSKVLSKAS